MHNQRVVKITTQENLALRHYFSVFVLSAGALLLESSLTRLLAVAQYYHFAFLVVSLALLGFGASGSLLSVIPAWFPGLTDGEGGPDRPRLLLLAGVGFTASLGVAYATINWLPFDSYSIAWDRRQVLFFVLYYLVLSPPFLFAGLGIGTVLSSSPGENNRVYAANLAGSATGILVGLLVMQRAGVPGALLASGGLGLSAVLGARRNLPKIWLALICSLLVVDGIALGLFYAANQRADSPVGITISPYKGLPYALRTPGSKNVFGAWNAISRIDVLSGASTHSLPGLSYTYQESLPEQLGMAFDGDALRPITLADPNSFRAAEFLPEAAAFHLHPGGNTLVVDSGSGLGVLQALASGPSLVTALVDNPLILTATGETAGVYDVFQRADLTLVRESPRIFLASPGLPFDVIFFPLNDPYRPIANGAYSLSENYDLTVEAFRSVFSRLSGNGSLVITRWLQTPPSESLRAWATLVEALESLGIDEPGDKLVAYRGIQTMTMLFRPGGWGDAQLAEIREFTEARKYDLVWAPGITPQEINRFNKLDEDVYHQYFSQLLKADSRDEFVVKYPYAIQPTTDDHPFFFHFFKWEQTPQILATFGRVWQPFGGSGFFVLVALLCLVSLLSFILILVPLLVQRRRAVKAQQQPDNSHSRSPGISPTRIFVYFGSIGIAFLFLEIPLIQQSILSMEHPAYGFGFVVLILMVSSSLGSMFSRRFWQRKHLVLFVLFGLAVLTPLLFRQVQGISLGMPPFLRIVLPGLCLVPLGVCMGFPFPFGLEWLEKEDTAFIPWAWAVNGCASVVAAVLAAMISLSAGFTIVIVLGAVFYGAAALSIR